MPGACRVGDKSLCPLDSHNCVSCPHVVEGPAIKGSNDVYINGKPALRLYDEGIHGECCGPNLWNPIEGAPTVFINSRAAIRKEDCTLHCGGSGYMIEGSGNVIIGNGQSQLFKGASQNHFPFVKNIAADRKRQQQILQENMEYLHEKGASGSYFNEDSAMPSIETSSSLPELKNQVSQPSIFEFFDGKKPGEIHDWGKGEFTQNAELYAHDITPEETAYLEHFNLNRIDSGKLTDKQLERATELFGDHPNKEILYSNWRTRARIINHYKFTAPATQAGLKHYYRFTRDLNPANFVAERGYQIGSGKEMFSGEKVSRAGAGGELLLYVALAKLTGKVSRIGADDGMEKLSAAERNMVDDIARQLAGKIEQSQAAALRATEKISNLPAKYQTKAVASDGYHTISGWDAKTTSAPNGYSRIEPSQIKEYSEIIGHKVTKSGRDINFPGQTYSSHAEKQLTMLTDSPIGVSRKMCSDCQNFFSKHSQYTNKTYIVTDPEMTRIFTPDGQITPIPLKK